MYVCSTIVPSIKAMWHNILKSLENGFALGKTLHWDDFNWCYPENFSKLSSKKLGSNQQVIRLACSQNITSFVILFYRENLEFLNRNQSIVWIDMITYAAHGRWRLWGPCQKLTTFSQSSSMATMRISSLFYDDAVP